MWVDAKIDRTTLLAVIHAPLGENTNRLSISVNFMKPRKNCGLVKYLGFRKRIPEMHLDLSIGGIQLEYGINKRISVGSLAKLLCMSASTLRRRIYNEHRCSPKEWLVERRLARATALLHEGTPVKVVAFSLGYKQLSHFSRDYRRRYGHPPSQALKREAQLLERMER